MKIQSKIKYVGFNFTINSSIFNNMVFTLIFDNGYKIKDNKGNYSETHINFIKYNLNSGYWKLINENTSK